MEKEELNKIAELAMLKLSDKECQILSTEIGSMLDNFSIMQDIDLENLPPTTHIMDFNNSLRTDNSVVNNSDYKETTNQIIEEFPEKNDRFVVIPGVL